MYNRKDKSFRRKASLNINSTEEIMSNLKEVHSYLMHLKSSLKLIPWTDPWSELVFWSFLTSTQNSLQMIPFLDHVQTEQLFKT